VGRFYFETHKRWGASLVVLLCRRFAQHADYQNKQEALTAAAGPKLIAYLATGASCPGCSQRCCPAQVADICCCCCCRICWRILALLGPAPLLVLRLARGCCCCTAAGPGCSCICQCLLLHFESTAAMTRPGRQVSGQAGGRRGIGLPVYARLHPAGDWMQLRMQWLHTGCNCGTADSRCAPLLTW
jgi:hypothetical protein